MDWIIANKEWFFSGAGISLIGLIYQIMKGKPEPAQALPSSPAITINNNNNNNNNNNTESTEKAEHTTTKEAQPITKTLQDYKNETKILFIDDDTKFKVAKILSRSGWVHTKLIKDADTLDMQDIAEANILFIDVQGVGIAMGFHDEGLGLALAVKKKYPSKKVIIYSAETQGNRFHEALRKADTFLAKNAEPYEFQQIVEEYTVGSLEQK